MKYQDALEIARGEVVALIGAGGKTSLLVGLGYELAEAGWRVLATTTLRLNAHQLELMPRALALDAGPQAISDALTHDKFVYLYDRVSGGQVRGLAPEAIRALLDAVDSDVLLVEADYAAGKPLKAPLAGQPVIPPETTLVIQVASLGALAATMDDASLYNAGGMIDRYGFAEGARVKSPWVALVLRDAELGLRGVPPEPRVVSFLNQTPARGYERGRARMIARLALKNHRISAVALGAIRGVEPVHEVQRPVGAVILAAGLSSRMGQSKVLMPWAEGRTIIEQIVEQVSKSRLDHIAVVTGHQAREVKAVLKPLEVNIVHNKAYKSGEMLSSIKAGLSAMPDHIAAALVVLGDQPRLQPKVIYQVMHAYAEGRSDLIVPSYQMRRGHPILIGRRYWPEILNLSADGSLRDLLRVHDTRIAYVEVDTDSILRDVDTPQDYEQERWRAGL
jgi:molybdenum cofactor cytidylyltransferase